MRFLGVVPAREETGDKERPQPEEPAPALEPVQRAQPEPEPEPEPEPRPVRRKRARPQSQNPKHAKKLSLKPTSTRASKRMRHEPPPPPPLSKRKSHARRHPRPGCEVLVNRVPKLPPPRRKYGRGRAVGLGIDMFLELCARERRKNRQWGPAAGGGCFLRRNLKGK